MGILFIVLGVIALAYQGITYTTQKKVLDIGPIQATKQEQKTIPLRQLLAPWLSWEALRSWSQGTRIRNPYVLTV
jgi:hypothetical protein